MPDPADPGLAAFQAQMKRRHRYGLIAGFVTLAVVFVMVDLVGSDTLSSYAFFVGAPPALAVYFFVAFYGVKRPKI